MLPSASNEQVFGKVACQRGCSSVRLHVAGPSV